MTYKLANSANSFVILKLKILGLYIVIVYKNQFSFWFINYQGELKNNLKKIKYCFLYNNRNKILWKLYFTTLSVALSRLNMESVFGIDIMHAL